MKKLIVLSLFVLVALGLNAQAFYFGGAFTGKSTWLLNKAVFDRGASQDIGASFGNDYEIVGGISFNDGGAGIEINFLFNNFSQNYLGTADADADLNSDFTSRSVYKSFDIPILFKTGAEGAYFEIGPVLSYINEATYERDMDDATLSDIEPPTDNLAVYNSTNFGAIMGFGGNIFLSDSKSLILTIGLRFYYGFTDISGVNAYGWDSKTTEDKDQEYQSSNPTKDNHWGHKDFKTNPLSGGLRIGLIYMIQD